MNLSAPALWVALVLVLIVLVASARQLRAPMRPRGPLSAVLGLQVIAAALLYACLLPPARQQPAAGLVVLGADAGRASAQPASDGPLLLLPEAAQVPGATRVPDLATALRQHPSTRLTLVGAGLEARDRDATLPAQVQWQAPPALAAGPRCSCPQMSPLARASTCRRRPAASPAHRRSCWTRLTRSSTAPR